MFALYNDSIYNKLDLYILCTSYFRYDSSKEILFAHRRRIKLAGLTVSTKAQTTCHYSTGRINITDNRAASYAFKADVTTAPRFHVLHVLLAPPRRHQIMNITIITGTAFSLASSNSWERNIDPYRSNSSWLEKSQIKSLYLKIVS